MADQDAPARGRRDRAEAADTARPAAHVSRITTRDADQYHAWVTDQFDEYKRKVTARRRGFEYFAEASTLGTLTAFQTGFRASTFENTVPPEWSHVIVMTLLSGRSRARWQGTEVHLKDRGTVLFPPGESSLLQDCSQSRGIRLGKDTLLRVAEELGGPHRSQVRFGRLTPVSPAAERHWLATADYLHRGIYTRSLDHPLLIAAAEQLAATVILATFPNTTMTLDDRTPRDPATPAVIRRAIAFIDEHASEPLTLTDIATATGVVPRTLQYAFRRHRDTTPLAYLGHVRLAMAHDELLAADPGDATTIAAVATRCGYINVHTFAAAYRRVYGRPPSETLHP